MKNKQRTLFYKNYILTPEKVNAKMKKEEQQKDQIDSSNTIQTKPTQTETITEKYIGTLRIPKISLEKGFYDKKSKYNTGSTSKRLLR